MKAKVRIYDEWLAETFESIMLRRKKEHKKLMMELREQLMTSRIFEPDATAVRFVVQSLVIQPREVLPMLSLARLPFEKVWIEDDTHERLRAGVGHTVVNYDPNNVVRVSFMLHRENETRWRASVMPAIRDEPAMLKVAPFFSGWEYVIDTEHHVAPFVDDDRWWALLSAAKAEAADRADEYGEPFSLYSNDMLVCKALGYQPPMPGMVPPPDLLKLLPHIKVDPTEMIRWQDARSLVASLGCFWETGGTLRYLIGLLATINLVETRYTPDDKKLDRMMVGKRSIPYIASSKISINVPGKPLHRLARAHVAGWHNRAHEVRGHWRKHLDRESGETILKWVKEHQRGDAGLGFVRHEYQIHHGESR